MTFSAELSRSGWARTLNPAQREAVHALRKQNNMLSKDQQMRGGTHGFTVFMMPTTGPAKYLEARHHMPTGRVARWVIEPDGRISAHNYSGESRELVQVQV